MDICSIFAIGFVAAAYGKLPILAIAIIGISFAAYDYFISNKSDGESGNHKIKVLNDEEEDYSNGI